VKPPARCLHEDCEVLARRELHVGLDGRHLWLTLFGCHQCGCAWPFLEENFPLLTADAQNRLVRRATRRGFAWNAERYPLTRQDRG
jgi:hypothetical protein